MVQYNTVSTYRNIEQGPLCHFRWLAYNQLDARIYVPKPETLGAGRVATNRRKSYVTLPTLLRRAHVSLVLAQSKKKQ